VTAWSEARAARITHQYHTQLNGTPGIDPMTARHVADAAEKICGGRFGCYSAMLLCHFAVSQKHRIFQGETRSMRCIAEEIRHAQ
jgi:hypothetical protein